MITYAALDSTSNLCAHLSLVADQRCIPHPTFNFVHAYNAI